MRMDGDRISNLPESVLHHILSCLDMTEVMQTTTLLSTRWRYLWLSLPVINFERDKWKGNVFGFIDFVDRVLLCRSNSNLHKFSFKSSPSFLPIYHSHIEKWITSVARKQTHEIWLDIKYGSFELPNCLFTSSVRVFNFKSSFIFPINFPTTMCSSSNLKSLELEESILPAGNSDGELVFSCPVLENLALCDCDHGQLKVLNIHALKLKSVILSNNLPTADNSKCKIQICAPLLASIVLNGSFYNAYSLKSPSSLAIVKIKLTVCSIAWTRRLVEPLRDLNHTTTLTITIDHQDLPKCPYLIPYEFVNLRCFKLISSRCYWIYALKNILEKCPRMDTLVWVVKECKLEDDEGKWEAQLSSKCMFRQLKYVQVQNLNGCRCEFKFLKFILRHGVALESITITTTKACSKDK